MAYFTFSWCWAKIPYYDPISSHSDLKQQPLFQPHLAVKQVDRLSSDSKPSACILASDIVVITTSHPDLKRQPLVQPHLPIKQVDRLSSRQPKLPENPLDISLQLWFCPGSYHSRPCHAEIVSQPQHDDNDRKMVGKNHWFGIS
jgi:hypothetical protein